MRNGATLFLDRRADRPVVTERVLHQAPAVAPELVGKRLQHRGARADRAVPPLVGVLHGQVQRHRGGCRRRRAAGMFREMIRHHHRGAVDLDLAVQDALAVVGGHAEVLPAAERLRVERHRRGAVVHGEIRRHARSRVVALAGLLHVGLLGCVCRVLSCAHERSF